VQLVLGGPQIMYNGGLLHATLRYFDPARQRPGSRRTWRRWSKGSTRRAPWWNW